MDVAGEGAATRVLVGERTRAVMDVLDMFENFEFNPFDQSEKEAHLRETLAPPDVAALATPDLNTTPGNFARTSLLHLNMAEDQDFQLLEIIT